MYCRMTTLFRLSHNTCSCFSKIIGCFQTHAYQTSYHMQCIYWNESALVFLKSRVADPILAQESVVKSQSMYTNVWHLLSPAPFLNSSDSQDALTPSRPHLYLPSYPGYFWETHWLSMGLPEISWVTLAGMRIVWSYMEGLEQRSYNLIPGKPAM